MQINTLIFFSLEAAHRVSHFSMSVFVCMCVFTNIPRIRFPFPSLPSAQPLPNYKLRLEEPVFMEVWLNPVLTAFTYDHLILLLHSPTPLPISQTTPPPFVPFLYSSTFLTICSLSFFVQPCTTPHLPLPVPVVFHILFPFVFNALLHQLENFSEGGKKVKTNYNQFAWRKCTDVLLCTAGLQHSGGCLRGKGKKIGKGSSCRSRALKVMQSEIVTNLGESKKYESITQRSLRGNLG